MGCRLALSLGIVVLLCSGLALAEESSVLLAQADALYDPQNGEFVFDAYEGRLRESIRLYEEALGSLAADAVQTRSATLNRLARAYFELAEAYVPKGPDQEAVYVAGKDHALASLRLDPDFVAREGASFRDALANANDAEAVFWYGNNLGLYLNYHQLEAILGGGMRDVPVCYERAATLDETFLAGAPLRSLGCYLAQVPSFLGGDIVRAEDLLRRAADIDPAYLENATDLAEWVLKARDDAAFCATLADVRTRAADPTVMSAWPLYNTLALQQAEQLSTECP